MNINNSMRAEINEKFVDNSEIEKYFNNQIIKNDKNGELNNFIS